MIALLELHPATAGLEVLKGRQDGMVRAKLLNEI